MVEEKTRARFAPTLSIEELDEIGRRAALEATAKLHEQGLSAFGLFEGKLRWHNPDGTITADRRDRTTRQK